MKLALASLALVLALAGGAYAATCCATEPCCEEPMPCCD
jgi:hypothetical protein